MLVALLVVWLTVGTVVAVVMTRRGHALFSWAFLGIVLGPLAIPLAIVAGSSPHQRMTTVLADTSGTGPVNVLAGIDGSDEAVAAVLGVVQLLGPRIERVRLVAAVSLDAADNTLMFDDERRAAQRWLDAAVAAVGGAAPCDRMVVTGRPAGVLRAMATEGYDVIVVGRHGRGLSTRLFGSVAADLVRSAPVPVLVGGFAQPRVRSDRGPLATSGR